MTKKRMLTSSIKKTHSTDPLFSLPETPPRDTSVTVWDEELSGGQLVDSLIQGNLSTRNCSEIIKAGKNLVATITQKLPELK